MELKGREERKKNNWTKGRNRPGEERATDMWMQMDHWNILDFLGSCRRLMQGGDMCEFQRPRVRERGDAEQSENGGEEQASSQQKTVKEQQPECKPNRNEADAGPLGKLDGATGSGSGSTSDGLG